MRCGPSRSRTCQSSPTELYMAQHRRDLPAMPSVGLPVIWRRSSFTLVSATVCSSTPVNGCPPNLLRKAAQLPLLREAKEACRMATVLPHPDILSCFRKDVSGAAEAHLTWVATTDSPVGSGSRPLTAPAMHAERNRDCHSCHHALVHQTSQPLPAAAEPALSSHPAVLSRDMQKQLQQPPPPPAPSPPLHRKKLCASEPQGPDTLQFGARASATALTESGLDQCTTTEPTYLTYSTDSDASQTSLCCANMASRLGLPAESSSSSSSDGNGSTIAQRSLPFFESAPSSVSRSRAPPRMSTDMAAPPPSQVATPVSAPMSVRFPGARSPAAGAHEAALRQRQRHQRQQAGLPRSVSFAELQPWMQEVRPPPPPLGPSCPHCTSRACTGWIRSCMI